MQTLCKYINSHIETVLTAFLLCDTYLNFFFENQKHEGDHICA